MTNTSSSTYDTYEHLCSLHQRVAGGDMAHVLSNPWPDETPDQLVTRLLQAVADVAKRCTDRYTTDCRS